MDANKARHLRAAEILWRCRIEGRRIAALPEDCRPRSLAEGYAVQDAMAELTGLAAMGWKIAATSAAGQRHIGVGEPLGGRLFADFLIADGGELAGAPLHMGVAEAEFAFRLGRDLPARVTSYDINEVCAAVSELHLAIEIPDARFERFAEAGAAQIAADDAFASWFVLGQAVADWRELDLPNQAVQGLKNGVLVGEGRGANVLGDPRTALTWLANDRSRRGGGLAAGDVITTGTCLKPVAISPGDEFVADFGLLGHVTLSFV
jgi:2-keto-4-pentenoate hydratase